MREAWAGSDRRDRLPSDWKDRRAFVFERDGYRCRALLPDGRRCPNDATDADHIVENDDDSHSNLQALCAPHHRTKTSSYAGKQSAEARRKRIRHPRRREPEAHWSPDS